MAQHPPLCSTPAPSSASTRSSRRPTPSAALACEAAGLLAALSGRPLLRGKAAGRACGIVRAVGYVNFLADPDSPVHLRTAELAPLFGISEATAANRDRDVRDLLDLARMGTGRSRAASATT